MDLPGRQHVALRRGALIVAAAAAVTGASTAVAAAATARHVVRAEDGERPDDVEVLAVGAGTVTLRADEVTTVPGRYGLWLNGGAGHARLGDVVDHDVQADTVTRTVLGVDRGQLRPGPARWNTYFYSGDPAAALGLGFETVRLTSGGSVLPAWRVPPPPGTATGRWAILVHGRGADREEGLRALPVLGRLGTTTLIVSYRNDVDAEPSDGSPVSRRHYHLGASEWIDVEAAILYARQAGASEVVLFGYSMGGAICLQLLDRSWTADQVQALVLDAPVIDWRNVLDHNARINHVPVRVGRLAQSMIAHDHARRLIGLEMPLPLDRMDWVERAAELGPPILLLHSDDDEFVPSGPSRRLAASRPDLVRLVSFRQARHTAEWNVDPEGWDTEVARFLLDV